MLFAEAPQAAKPPTGFDRAASGVFAVLEPGNHSLKTVIAGPAGSGVRIHGAVCHRLPALLRGGRGRRAADRARLTESVLGATAVLRERELQGTVTLVLGGDLLRYQVFEFTSHHQARLQDEGNLRRTIRRYLRLAKPEGEEDILLAIRPGGIACRRRRDLRAVLAVAAPRLVVEEKIWALRQAGCEVDRVTAASLAFEALLQRRDLLESSCPGASGVTGEGLVGVANLGTRATELTLYRDGRLVHARSMRGGGDLLGEALRANLSDLLEMPSGDEDRVERPGEAERNKKRYGLALGRLEASAGALAREIGELLREGSTEAGGSLGALLLAGGTARTPGLRERIEREAGVPTGVLRFPDSWLEDERDGALHPRRRAAILARTPEFAPAVAAALERAAPPEPILEEREAPEPAEAATPARRGSSRLAAGILFGFALATALALATAFLSRAAFVFP